MPRALSRDYLDFSKGCFDSQSKLIDSDLNMQTLKDEFPRLKGSKVSKKGKTIIQKVRVNLPDLSSSTVLILLPSKTVKPIPFKQIIDADKIIRYHLKNNEYPVKSDTSKYDYRNPHRDTGAGAVQESSFAPRLAEHMRKHLQSNM